MYIKDKESDIVREQVADQKRDVEKFKKEQEEKAAKAQEEAETKETDEQRARAPTIADNDKLRGMTIVDKTMNEGGAQDEQFG